MPVPDHRVGGEILYLEVHVQPFDGTATPVEPVGDLLGDLVDDTLPAAAALQARMVAMKRLVPVFHGSIGRDVELEVIYKPEGELPSPQTGSHGHRPGAAGTCHSRSWSQNPQLL